MHGIALTFDKGDKIAEIGGGSRPAFHPCIDIRKVEGVDIVCDVGKDPLPFDDKSLDGIYCSYMIEHLPFRRVRYFIGECFRILRTGGKAIFITANLWEQAKKIANTLEEELNFDDMSCLIFGGQGAEGEEEGSHKCGFSPKVITTLYAKAGFSKVNVWEHPVSATDMVVEVEK